MSLNKNLVLSAAAGLLLSTLIAACSSAPKVSKDPGEETALNAKAQAAIAAGPTESAKAGGYDHLPFWQDRSKTADKYTDDMESKVWAYGKKMYVLDFKVAFTTGYFLGEGGGTGAMARMGERMGSAGAGGMKSVTVSEKRKTSVIVGTDDATLQKITDQIYQDLVARLKASGYEVVDRSNITYEDMKEYLAKNDNFLPSPQQVDAKRIFAPTGWMLEKSTYVPSLGGAFGDTLMKLGEQNSRKVDDSISVSASYEVELGGVDSKEFVQKIRITNASVNGTAKWIPGAAVRLTKPIGDGMDYQASLEPQEVDRNAAGKLAATLGSMALGSGIDYTTSQVIMAKPNSENLQERVLQHADYANDLMFQMVREGRDD